MTDRTDDIRLVDFHTHTLWSDGHTTMPGLIRLAAEKNLDYLSITDHDTYRAMGESNIEMNKRDELADMKQLSQGMYDFRGTRILRGIELTADDGGNLVHIVGHCIDEPDEKIQNYLDNIKQQRIARFKEIISVANRSTLAMVKIKLDAEQILMEIVSSGVPSRLHAGFAISEALNKKYSPEEIKKIYDHEMTPSYAMRKFVNRGADADVRIEGLYKPEEAIEAILSLHGIPVLPHVREIEDVGFSLAWKLEEYAGYGLCGVETINSKVHGEEMLKLESWIKENVERLDLEITIPSHIQDMQGLKGMPFLYVVGSDYHGSYSDRQLGVPIHRKHLERFEQALDRIKRPTA